MVNMAIHFLAIPSEHVYFVPIDYVQELITALFQVPVCNKTYHVTGASPVTTLQINQAMCNILKMNGVRVDSENTDPNMDDKLMTRFLGDLLPYFSSDIEFDQSNVIEALGPKILAWPYGLPGLMRPDAQLLRRLLPGCGVDTEAGDRLRRAVRRGRVI